MSDTLTIRPIGPDDKEAWAPLWTAYLEFYETSVPDNVYDVSFDRVTSGEEGRFKGNLAWYEDKAVGLVHYLYHDHMWRHEQVCYLQDLYAAPEVRGQGVGAALITSVYEAADRDGAPTVYWLTQDFNARARKLYDQIGSVTPFIKYQRPAK